MKRFAFVSQTAAYRAGSRLRDLRESSAYDAVMRLPLLIGASVFAAKNTAILWEYEREADLMMPDVPFAVNVATQLLVITFFVLLGATALLRGRPKGRSSGIEPRISAMMGTFSLFLIVLFPLHELSFVEGIFASLLLLLGNAIAVMAIGQLGSSFSVMAEARRIVVTGLYRFVRHPVYLAEFIACAGGVMLHLSPWTVLILCVQGAFQLRRIHNEEIVLQTNFPEYAAYMKSVPKLIPAVYRGPKTP